MLLRLLTYNVWDGARGRGSLVLQVVEEVGADVILFQEVIGASPAHELSEALGMQYFVAEGSNKRKIGVLTHFNVLAATSHQPFPLKNGLLEISLEYRPNWCITLYGIHLTAYFHIAFELWRVWEVRTILRRIRRAECEFVVLAGDFNAIAPHDQVAVRQLPAYIRLMLFSQGGRVMHTAIGQILTAGLIDCYRLANPSDPGYTVPAGNPNARLDYFFASPPLRNSVRTCRTIHEPAAVRQASDHLPLLLELELPER